MKTPFEKLVSLEHAELYLKSGITFEALRTLAKQHSDLKAWEAMQKARTKLFNDIFGLQAVKHR